MSHIILSLVNCVLIKVTMAVVFSSGFSVTSTFRGLLGLPVQSGPQKTQADLQFH